MFRLFILQSLLINEIIIRQCFGFTSILKRDSRLKVSTSTYALSVPQPMPESSQSYGYNEYAPSRYEEEPFFATPKYSAPVRPSGNTRQSSLVPLGRPNTNSYNNVKTSLERWKEVEATATVQGNSLKTYSFDTSVERVELFMKSASDGRPINAELALWQGPNNTPATYKVYVEDGDERTFHAIIETPGGTNSVAIRNIASAQYPLMSGIDLEKSGNTRSPAYVLNDQLNYPPKTVQGGAVYTVPFKSNIDSVQVSLSTDGRPMHALIELLQGPSNKKQSMEIQTEDGYLRPFYAIIDTPAAGNVVRVVNKSCIEFPLYASIEPYSEQV